MIRPNYGINRVVYRDYTSFISRVTKVSFGDRATRFSHHSYKINSSKSFSYIKSKMSCQ